MTKVSSQELVSQAKSQTTGISVEDATKLLDDPSVLFVDVRDSMELADGIVPEARHVPRGGLEFALDRESGLAEAELLSASRLIMVCGSGGRAALAAKLGCEMGYQALWLDGGFKAWKAAGKPVSDA